MVTVKKITFSIVIILSTIIQGNLHAMEIDQQEQIKNENKKIRQYIILMKDLAPHLINNTKTHKFKGKFKFRDLTISSFDGNTLSVTFYFPDKSQCTRTYDQFIQIMQEKDTDTDEPNVSSLEQLYNLFHEQNDSQLLIPKDKKNKKCCSCWF